MIHFVEAVIDREIFGLIPQMPFPGIVCAITVLLKEFGDRWHFLADMVRVAWSDDRRQRGPNGDAASDERSTACGATRLAVPIREPCAFGCEPVQIRCRCTACDAAAVATKVAPAHVVGHDNDNIRSFGCRPGGRCW